ISDLRNMDVALGGQGAPIVPLGEKLLFADYDYWLNLGGICNISFQENGTWKAFDIGACNQVLDALALEVAMEYDEGGKIAASGKVNTELLSVLNELEYFRKSPPKSLDNSFSEKKILPIIYRFDIPLPDKLRTAVEHIAVQIDACVAPAEIPQKLLATGGGALNTFLIERLSALLQEKKVAVIVPDMQTVQYKEALIMALLGALRWMGKATVMSSVTGGTGESVGGAVWVGKG
ncbi:MAG: anhydro-N-acetylmuramic acid kinase, partial [Chitinophagaceae bacterium]